MKYKNKFSIKHLEILIISYHLYIIIINYIIYFIWFSNFKLINEMSRISSKEYFTPTFIMSSVQRAFTQKLSKQHAADVRRQIATSTSYSRDLSKSGSSFSGFSSTVYI